ncbi:hypothetical protein [Polyangium spumosum]|uniref:Uncharacterized protein n=1 Tax=Polyangium spumosum TaxID=889282 RepID=A0A6N7PLC0_9BACT|nr:hypothetical protein [Polyangium spumosum]MRG91626.1 hypothetical protein [Polyangium spumosum]
MWPAVLGLVGCVGLGSATTGCIIVDDNDGGTVIIDDRDPLPEQPMLMSIETDVALESVPGDGVGVFVEYYSGGTYRIWTTCDTNFSGSVCPMDIFTSVDQSSSIHSVTTVDLEGADQVNINEAAGTVDMYVDTSVDIDAIEINTTPGAILRVEVLIDGVAQPRFVYWFGNGVLHNGAPTSPVDFVPTVP